MPANSWNTYADDPQLFLDNLHFRTAVFIASPLFFSCLEQKKFIYEDLSEKEKLSFRKYINRFCFRPTPFGLFAGVSLIRWEPQTQLAVQPISANDIIILPDQAYVLKLSRELLDGELQTGGLFEPNPTLYRLLDEYRFISTEIDGPDQARKFLLQSIEYSVVLRQLASFCAVPKSRQKVIAEISRLANCITGIAEDYFNFLSAEQFFVERDRANITGPGYLELLLEQATQAGKNSERSLDAIQIISGLKTVNKIDASVFRDLNDQLKQLLLSGLPDNTKNQFNVILNRKLDSGRLSTAWQDQIGDALFALNILCPNEPIAGMAKFAKAFQKDFEGQDLDLLYALDPEVGIGYFVPEIEMENQLLETLNITPKANEDRATKWTPAHSFLLEHWHKAIEKPGLVIRLNEEDLAALNNDPTEVDFTGMSVLFRIFNDQVYIESAGGVNAPAMMGRFTVGDPEITAAARKIARQQEADNPDIIFAEILHLAGPHTDNVNRREVIWSYELPVTAASTLPKEKQLALSDLKIRIENNKVLLYSAKHRKLVIPRLTSAYNHSIDKLPLFRFLADLSYQYGRNGFNLDLRQFFPGLSFYPRVEYKRSILCLATWVISEKQVQLLIQKGTGVLVPEFKLLSKTLGLPPVFSLSEGDQQLVFFRDRDQDIVFFARCINQKKEVILKEYLLEKQESPLVKDGSNRPLISQFNTFIIPQNPIAFGPIKISPPMADKQQRKFIPGSEWLYLKIYTSKIGSKRLLLKIVSLLRRKYSGGQIQKWFFIRYEDHAPHIRLRMQILPQDISEILIAFKSKLEDGINQHVIREYQVDVYSRELERYQAAGMEATEDFFWASSELAVSFLKMKEKGDALQIYKVALLSVQEIINTFLPDSDLQLHFTDESYRQFFPEFKEKTIRVDLDKKYRELGTAIQQLFSHSDYFRSSGLVKVSRRFKHALYSLSAVIKEGESDKEGYVRSVIHMHLNRLFTDESRKQEMVVYYLLYKFLRSEKGRRKNNTV
jgi:thiopeptide-type bacteriocin biosynthesis protein